jgi:hypothetical protein
MVDLAATAGSAGNAPKFLKNFVMLNCRFKTNRLWGSSGVSFPRFFGGVAAGEKPGYNKFGAVSKPTGFRAASF